MDEVIVAFYAVQVAIEKIQGGDLAAPYRAGQFGSGPIKERIYFLDRSGAGILRVTADKNRNEKEEKDALKNPFRKAQQLLPSLGFKDREDTRMS